MNFDHGRLTGKGLRTQKGLHSGGKKISEAITSEHKNALNICHISISGILASFLAFTPQDIRTVPNWIFAQVAYASILLIKLYLAASSPEWELGEKISSDEMNVGKDIASVIDLLRAGAENGKSRPAHNFSLVMAMLQVWYEKQVNDRADDSSAAAKDAPEQKLQNGEAQSTPAQPEHHQHSHGPPAMGQTPLHLLSEVAMGNSGSSGHPIGNGGEGAYDSSTTSANATNVPAADSHPQSMVGDGLRRMHPGFEQALGMTLAVGDLNSLEDDGFFDLMQKTSNMFEANGG